MPISPHDIQAGKYAPKSSNEGAAVKEQPVNMQLGTTTSAALDSDGSCAPLRMVSPPDGKKHRGEHPAASNCTNLRQDSQAVLFTVLSA
jgi:hypothetical protein